MASSTSSTTSDAANSEFLSQSYARLRALVSARLADDDNNVLPTPSSIQAAISSLPTSSSPSVPSESHDSPHPHSHDRDTSSSILPTQGLGPQETLNNLLSFAASGLNSQSLSSRYYGFVTGGTLPIAEAADNIVTAYDQNVQVHLPSHSASTFLEDAALKMLSSLLGLPAHEFLSRTFTTGATGSNIMGLACAREAVISARLPPKSPSTGETGTVAEMGLLEACLAANIKKIQVLTTMGHSSLSKAASLVGLGHNAIKQLPANKAEPWRLDLDAVEAELERGEKEGIANIIAVSAGEVNTGRFALHALDMPKLSSLAKRYKSWIHVDGAFGIFARALPRTDEFNHLHACTAGLELADSITADGHKLLNVPYDNGIFFCRHLSIVDQVFKNPNAAYLASAAAGPGAAIIPSPLNNGIENSRRFRALPVYAVLLSEGREGMAAMFARMIHLARGIAQFIRDSEYYEWLPDQDASLEQTHIIVLFRAKDPKLNEVLTDRINKTRRVFVSGTSWEGRKAVRLAVSNWRVDVERDLAVVKQVLLAVATSSSLE